LGRLHVDARGKYLGEFDGVDKIFLLLEDGSYELRPFELSTHFDAPISRIEKYNHERGYIEIHQDGKTNDDYVKRFRVENTAVGKRTTLINEEPGSKMILATNASHPRVKIDITKGKSKIPESYEEDLLSFIDVKGMKAQGNRLTPHEVVKIELLSEEVPEEPKKGGSPQGEGDGGTDTLTEGRNPVDVAGEGAKAPSTPSGDEPTATAHTGGLKKLELEITNPEDVEIDDKGQIGLF